MHSCSKPSEYQLCNPLRPMVERVFLKQAHSQGGFEGFDRTP